MSGLSILSRLKSLLCTRGFWLFFFGRKVPIGCEEANLAFVQAESSRDHRSMEGEFCYTQHFVHIVCFLFCFHNRSAFCIANNLCSLTHHHVNTHNE
ncbi:hypothetical protein E4T38_07043 [Aureobasidium subglaciale]|nr:hypothetical protein E4T38_07043 [Aureobasidium subglaciale]KAI5218269.1 hypothetical protein E4T40_06974 [Aureobasidium subglaciale]KAI5221709.1 hypothetical protein E4T41_06894 [Aureobasidium subglaciale]KAI5259147.1 hypothetical protein E4T46_06872 [Aureobasidium subglaciale]